MKYYISYFYQIRFFDKTMIPISTAVWDPKWFHDFKGKNYVWKDKHDVYNGIRFEELNPESCHADGCPCPLQKTELGYTDCKFLRGYHEGLSKLDFDELISKCEMLADIIKEKENIDDEMKIVFIVYETPDNPCSERVPLQELFKSHGIDLKEWQI